MKIAVIVGRFQVSSLTQGHLHLFKFAKDNFDKILVILGETKGNERDEKNPLPINARKRMILNNIDVGISQKVIGIFEIQDVGNIKKWSENLDNMLDQMLPAMSYQLDENKIVLLGSRDSVVTGSYSGRYNIKEVPELKGYSGTLSREEVKEPNWGETKIREAIIWIMKNKK